MGWPANLWHMSWLCVSRIILNSYLLFSKIYPCNLNGHSHSLKLVSSYFNFRIRVVYLPLLSHLSATNSSLISEPLFDLSITTPTPNLAASSQIHSLLQKTHFTSCVQEILLWLHKWGNKGRHENFPLYPQFLINQGDNWNGQWFDP